MCGNAGGVACGALAPCGRGQLRRERRTQWGEGLTPRMHRSTLETDASAERDPSPALNAYALKAPSPTTRGEGKKAQFFDLSTSAPFLIHGIMSRSLAPTSSMGWAESLARVALNEVWLTLFSSIQSRANLPDWMSLSTRFISFLVSSVTMRGPVTYSPYSAVLEIE